MEHRPNLDLNRLATVLRRLHVPGQPLLLANVHDGASAGIVASLSATKAIATASWAIAETQGLPDEELTLEANLAGISFVSRGLQRSGKADTIPLSADIQDGYADIPLVIERIIQLGVVGCNIEDSDQSQQPPPLRSKEDAASRIRQVMEAARANGVPDFVVNARCDALGYDGCDIEQVIERGRAYLEAGATTVFVWWNYRHHLSENDIQRLVQAFDHRLAVQPGLHSSAKLSDLGVSRISIGPMLWRTAQRYMTEQAQIMVEGRLGPQFKQ